jgi:hypothetical protein
MLFGFVFMEKNTKNKKKRDAFEIPLPHISTLGALQNIIQTDLGSYSVHFLTIFGNWSCDHHPNIPLHGP